MTQKTDRCPCNKRSVKRAKAHDRLLEWETGPAAEALEDFKKNKIHAGILAKVGYIIFPYSTSSLPC